MIIASQAKCCFGRPYVSLPTKAEVLNMRASPALTIGAYVRQSCPRLWYHADNPCQKDQRAIAARGLPGDPYGRNRKRGLSGVDRCTRSRDSRTAGPRL